MSTTKTQSTTTTKSSSIFRFPAAATTTSADPYEMVGYDGTTSTSPPAATVTPKNPLVRFFETNILLNGIGDGQQQQVPEKELEELSGRAVRIMPTAAMGGEGNKTGEVGGFDICQEYSYDGDEDDEHHRTNNSNKNNNKPTRIDSSAMSEGGDHNSTDVMMTYILGRAYHPIHGLHERRDDESSLFWFTYRCDFPEIAPYNITSDAGWGCMLRSAQMMLGQALRMHYKSRGWRPVHLLARRRQDPFVRSLLTWFADFPSSTENVYSLHNMVACGLAKYDKLPGEWYGPGTACYVVRDLVEMHQKHLAAKATKQQQQQQNTHNKNQSSSPSHAAAATEKQLFRVHVASQALVCRDEIEALMTRDSKARLDKARLEKEKESQPAHPLDLAWEEELIESVDPVSWDTSLLLLIPLRLGLKSFNEEYIKAVAHTFSLPQSVGVLGGRPRGARWFYGAVADGSRILGLDPHTVQNAPRKRNARVNGKTSSVVELSDDYLRSVHTTYPEVFSLQKMDPSIALAFYCRTRDDLENVLAQIQTFQEQHSELPELFSVADVAPNYSSNVSSAMDAMLDRSNGCASTSVMDQCDDDIDIDLDDDDLEGGASEEDEYVML